MQKRVSRSVSFLPSGYREGGREKERKEKNGKNRDTRNNDGNDDTIIIPRETKLCMYGGREEWGGGKEETWIFASRSHTKRYNGSFQSKRIAFLQPWASKRETPFGNFGRVES